MFVWCLLAAGSADAATLRVCASGCSYTGVQQAVDAAQPGDTILLRAGETFVGHVVLRKKTGTADILIRSDAADGDLPAAGVRLVPLDPRRHGAAVEARTAQGQGRQLEEHAAHRHRARRPQLPPAVPRHRRHRAGGATGRWWRSATTRPRRRAGVAPYALTFDRVYIHGDPVRGQKRCLALNSASTSVLNSYFADCKHFASDSQAIAGFNGPGPFLIENNYLEGSTENILFGGSDPKIPNLVPSDIIIRRNHITKPLAWRNAVLARARQPAGGDLVGERRARRRHPLLQGAGRDGLRRQLGVFRAVGGGVDRHSVERACRHGVVGGGGRRNRLSRLPGHLGGWREPLAGDDHGVDHARLHGQQRDSRPRPRRRPSGRSRTSSSSRTRVASPSRATWSRTSGRRRRPASRSC